MKEKTELNKGFEKAIMFINIGCILLLFSAIMSFCSLVELIHIGEITIELFADLLLFIFSTMFLIMGLYSKMYIKLDKNTLSLILSVFELLKLVVKMKDKLVEDLSKLDDRVVNLETMKTVKRTKVKNDKN